ncbi:MAG: hypothetical protein RL348_738 [Bacteroidota bacterium]|jgi:spore coat protein U-like protein
MNNKKNILYIISILNSNFIYATCNIQNIQSANFGNINPLSGSNINTSGSFLLQCNANSGSNYSISLSAGYGTMLQRQMYSGLDFINYNLYTSNDYSNVWGDGTNGSSIQSGSFASGPKNRNYIIYARISALDQSNIAVGTYSDNISINVTYN